MLTQTEIDNLLIPDLPKESTLDTSFLNEIEKSIKNSTNQTYIRPPVKIPQPRPYHNHMDRKVNEVNLCGGCKQRMEHVFVFRVGGGGHTLHAWCKKCNWYQPI